MSRQNLKFAKHPHGGPGDKFAIVSPDAMSKLEASDPAVLSPGSTYLNLFLDHRNSPIEEILSNDKEIWSHSGMLIGPYNIHLFLNNLYKHFFLGD